MVEKLPAEKEFDYTAVSKSLIDAFTTTNSQIFAEKFHNGSTSLVAFVKKNKCNSIRSRIDIDLGYLANAGDSRAVLGTFDPLKLQCPKMILKLQLSKFGTQL